MWLDMDSSLQTDDSKWLDSTKMTGADADISAIHGPIADISKIFKACFLLHYQKYYVFHALPFFKNFKNQDLWVKIFKL